MQPDTASARSGIRFPHASWQLAAEWMVLLIPIACALSRFASDVLLSTVAVMFLVHSLASRRTEWLKTRWLQVALLLWGITVLRAFFSEDIVGAMGRSLSWLRYPVFTAALCFWVLENPRMLQRMIYSLTYAIGFLLIDTAFQYFVGVDMLGFEPYPGDGSPRLTGPFSSPRVGIVLIWMAIPVLAYWLMSKRREGPHAARQYWLGIGIGVACVVGLMTVIFMTGERMAFLLTCLAFTVAFFLLPVSKWLMLAAGILAIGCVALTAYFNPGLIDRQYGSTSDVVGEFSGSDYGQIWLSAIQMIKEYPALGVGLRQFRVLCPEERFGPLDTIEQRCNLHPHNMYLEWATEAGLIGFALYLTMVFLIARTAVLAYPMLRAHPLYLGLLITVFIRFWPLASTTSFFTAWSGVPMWLMVGWLLAVVRVETQARMR